MWPSFAIKSQNNYRFMGLLLSRYGPFSTTHVRSKLNQFPRYEWIPTLWEMQQLRTIAKSLEKSNTFFSRRENRYFICREPLTLTPKNSHEYGLQSPFQMSVRENLGFRWQSTVEEKVRCDQVSPRYFSFHEMFPENSKHTNEEKCWIFPPLKSLELRLENLLNLFLAVPSWNWTT